MKPAQSDPNKAFQLLSRKGNNLKAQKNYQIQTSSDPKKWSFVLLSRHCESRKNIIFFCFRCQKLNEKQIPIFMFFVCVNFNEWSTLFLFASCFYLILLMAFTNLIKCN